ncbi:MAG: bacterial Ig-like domain-containing protein [Lachnospiraceae bacterium]|nr:bacterial Ig-like domain-containing protein [Lachnospiraceae bacterium]
MKKWKTYVAALTFILFVWMSLPVQAAGKQADLPENLDDIRNCVATMNQTVYCKGEKLNLDGLQLQAYDYWGNIWTFSGDELVTNADKIDMNPEFTDDDYTSKYVDLEVSVKGYEEYLNNVIPITVYQEPNDSSDAIVNIYATKSVNVYNVGDTLDTKDITVYGVGLNNTIKKLSSDEYTIDASGVDMKKAGEEYQIKVTYNSSVESDFDYKITDDITVYVLEKESKLVKITATKKKTTYQVGDTINVDDLVVTAYYADGSRKIMQPYDKKDNIRGYSEDSEDIDTSVAGTQNLQIACVDVDGTTIRDCTILITITDGTGGGETTKKLSGLKFQGSTPEYAIGDSLSLEDFELTITAVYSDGTTKELTEDDYTTDIDDLDTETAGKYELTITYTEGVVTKTAKASYIVKSDAETEKVLTNITLDKNKTEYEVGEDINIDDLLVTAIYSDSTIALLKTGAYTTNVDELDTSKAGTLTLTVTYKENGVVKTANIKLTVKEKTESGDGEKVLTKITATKKKTTYSIDDTIGTDDLVVMAVYSDESKVKLKEAIDEGYQTNLESLILDIDEAGTYDLIVTYSEGKIEKTATIKLTIVDGDGGDEAVALSGIKAEKTKKEYEVGDTIKVDDIKVTATYEDGTTAEVTGFTTNVDKLKTDKAGTVNLVVTYVEGEITKTATIKLTIKAKSGGDEEKVVLESIKAEKTKKEYEIGDTIKVDDIKVTATYEDGTTAEVTGFTTNVDKLSTATKGTKILVVTYEENGVKKTAKISIVIKAKTTSNPTPNPTPSPNPGSGATTPTPSPNPGSGTTTPTTQPSTPTPATQPVTQPAAQAPATQSAAPVIPGNVSGVKVKALGKKKVSIKWSKAENAFAYVVEISTKKNFKNAKQKATSNTNLTWKNLKKGKTYYVRIKAASFDKQWSAWTKVKKVKVK